MTCRYCVAVAVIGLLMYGPAMPAADGGDEMFRYSFNNSSIETVADESGNGLNGSIHGAQPVKSGDGYALAFDGENDYLEVPDHPNRQQSKPLPFQELQILLPVSLLAHSRFWGT